MPEMTKLAIHKGSDSELEVAGLRFRACRREIESVDGGVTLQVFGPIGTEEAELLRFDCFRKAPHYHAPGEDRKETRIDSVAPDQAREWVFGQLATQIEPLLVEGGFGDLAQKLDLGALANLTPKLQTLFDSLAEPSETSYFEIDSAILAGRPASAD